VVTVYLFACVVLQVDSRDTGDELYMLSGTQLSFIASNVASSRYIRGRNPPSTQRRHMNKRAMCFSRWNAVLAFAATTGERLVRLYVLRWGEEDEIRFSGFISDVDAVVPSPGTFGARNPHLGPPPVIRS
jgi:hypothetical protein